jgi:hypothetical protein
MMLAELDSSFNRRFLLRLLEPAERRNSKVCLPIRDSFQLAEVLHMVFKLRSPLF